MFISKNICKSLDSYLNVLQRFFTYLQKLRCVIHRLLQLLHQPTVALGGNKEIAVVVIVYNALFPPCFWERASTFLIGIFPMAHNKIGEEIPHQYFCNVSLALCQTHPLIVCVCVVVSTTENKIMVWWMNAVLGVFSLLLYSFSNNVYGAPCPLCVWWSFEIHNSRVWTTDKKRSIRRECVKFAGYLVHKNVYKL